MMRTDTTLTGPDPPPRTVADEPRPAMPTGPLVLAAMSAAAGCAAAWTAVTMIGGWSAATVRAGWLGALAVVIAMVASLVAIRPWKARPLTHWMTSWIVSTGLRLLIAPVGAILLYSAAAPGPEALAISVALAYLLSLLAEALVLARHVARLDAGSRTARESGGMHRD